MKKAFMIMQIGNPELDDMYESIYKPIAQECGLRIFRVDKDNEGDLIKKTIDKYIEEAEIIIADLTNERPSCYHEVGYAYGLKKHLNVILTIREDHLPTSKNFNNNSLKIHFDLNDYPRIAWKKEEINEFKKKLTQEINRRLSEIENKGNMEKSIKNSKSIEESIKAKFIKVKNLMPELIADIKRDLSAEGNNVIRELFIKSKNWHLNAINPHFEYYFEEHENLQGKMHILENYMFVKDVTPSPTGVKKYRLTEKFVGLILGQ
jgi:hypothetical protein